jgi:hypothetical protein
MSMQPICRRFVAARLIAFAVFAGSAAGSAAATLRLLPPGVPSGVIAVQAAPGALNTQRDCQTLRTCQFSKGGSFRGCVSSYSCRSCRFVPSKCTIGAAGNKCQRQVCDWGG